MATKTPSKPKPPKELYQQGVLELRPEDQFVIRQNGSEKLMLVASFKSALVNMMANKFADMWETTPVQPHTHPESEVDNLETDITNFIAALANKAAVNHGHSEDDITGLVGHLNAIADALADRAALNHSHPESDITGLVDQLAAIATALDGKAPLVHTHLVTDIQKNFADLTSGTAVAYDGSAYAVAKATVSGGNAVFQFTKNGAAGGQPVFPNGPIPNSELFRAEEGTNPIATGVAVWSNSNKTLTVPVSRVGAAVTILGISVLGATVAANGTVIYATVRGR